MEEGGGAHRIITISRTTHSSTASRKAFASSTPTPFHEGEEEEEDESGRGVVGTTGSSTCTTKRTPSPDSRARINFSFPQTVRKDEEDPSMEDPIEEAAAEGVVVAVDPSHTPSPLFASVLPTSSSWEVV